MPDPSVRVKRNVSNALPRERIPSDPGHVYCIGAAGDGKIERLRTALPPDCRDRGF